MAVAAAPVYASFVKKRRGHLYEKIWDRERHELQYRSLYLNEVAHFKITGRISTGA
jgi:hypothetical protein